MVQLVTIENRTKATSVAVVGLFIVSMLAVLGMPAAVATDVGLTASASPTAVNAKEATDIAFTVTNNATSASSLVTIELRFSVNWTVLTAANVNTSGLGGNPTVSIAGTGPWAVTIGGASLPPGIAGTVTLRGMVATVGGGASYNDTATVVGSGQSVGASGFHFSPAASIVFSITVPAGTSTNLFVGIGVDKVIGAGSISTASTARLNITAPAVVNSTTTIFVVGLDAGGTLLLVGGTTFTTAEGGVSKTLDIFPPAIDTTAERTYSSITDVVQAGGTVGNTFIIRRFDTNAILLNATVSGVNAGSGIVLAAWVTDNLAAGVTGQVVSFAIKPQAGDVTSPAGTLGSTTATTDASGKASVTYVTSTKVGSQNVEASLAGLLGSPRLVRIQGLVGTIAKLNVTASPTSLQAIGGATSQIKAKFTDTFDNTATPSPARTVNFGVAGPATIALTSTTIGVGGAFLTEAVTTLTVSSTAQSGQTITVTVVGGGLSGSASISLTTGTIASVSVAASPTSIDLGQSAAVTATAKDANGNPVSGALVVFTFDPSTTAGWAPVGSLDFAAAAFPPTLSTTQGTTGTDGKATVALLASIEAGTAVVTATAGGFSGNVSITVKVGSVARVNVHEALSGFLTIPANGTTTSLVWRTLDLFGNFVQVSGRSVTFNTTAGTFTDTNTAGTSGSTNASGIVVVTLKSTNIVQEVNVTATSGTASGVIKVTFAADAVDFRLTAKPVTVRISTNSTIRVTFTDASGRDAIVPPEANTPPNWDFDIITPRGSAPIDVDCTASTCTDTSAPNDISAQSAARWFEFPFAAPASVPPGSINSIEVTLQRTGAGGQIVFVRHTVTLIITDVPNRLVLVAGATTAPGDGATRVQISANLQDAAGQTIVFSPGTPVTFSASAGTLVDVNNVATTVVTTNTTTGVATIFVRAPLVGENGTAVNATVIAVGGGLANQVVVTFTPAAAAATLLANVEGARTTDLAGAAITAAARNQRILVEVTVKNTSPSAKTFVIAVQCFDSSQVALVPQFVIVTLEGGASFKYLAGIQMPNVAGQVSCEVNVYLDVLPAAGGGVTAQVKTATIQVT